MIIEKLYTYDCHMRSKNPSFIGKKKNDNYLHS